VRDQLAKTRLTAAQLSLSGELSSTRKIIQVRKSLLSLVDSLTNRGFKSGALRKSVIIGGSGELGLKSPPHRTILSEQITLLAGFPQPHGPIITDSQQTQNADFADHENDPPHPPPSSSVRARAPVKALNAGAWFK
jgi:hypothetical protein